MIRRTRCRRPSYAASLIREGMIVNNSNQRDACVAFIVANASLSISLCLFIGGCSTGTPSMNEASPAQTRTLEDLRKRLDQEVCVEGFASDAKVGALVRSGEIEVVVQG